MEKYGNGKLATVRKVVGDEFIEFKKSHPEKLNWSIVFKDFRSQLPTIEDQRLAKTVSKIYHEIGVECKRVSDWNLSK